MNKRQLSIAFFLGGMAVILGAFGAHWLKSKLEPEKLQVFETAVRYQVYHVFGIICSFLVSKYFVGSTKLFRLASHFFMAGIFLFSGSLYLLSTAKILGIEHWKWLGPVTPIGGLFFISGWMLLAWVVLRGKSGNQEV